MLGIPTVRPGSRQNGSFQTRLLPKFFPRSTAASNQSRPGAVYQVLMLCNQSKLGRYTSMLFQVSNAVLVCRTPRSTASAASTLVPIYHVCAMDCYLTIQIFTSRTSCICRTPRSTASMASATRIRKWTTRPRHPEVALGVAQTWQRLGRDPQSKPPAAKQKAAGSGMAACFQSRSMPERAAMMIAATCAAHMGWTSPGFCNHSALCHRQLHMSFVFLFGWRLCICPSGLRYWSELFTVSASSPGAGIPGLNSHSVTPPANNTLKPISPRCRLGLPSRHFIMYRQLTVESPPTTQALQSFYR